ncbi:MAG: hypothetical protein ABR579_00590 [Actinomycetota bacterium]
MLHLCDFGVLASNQAHSQRLLHEVIGNDLSELVRELDSTGRAPGGAIACPADFGNRDLLRFRYSDEVRLDVVVEFSGCRFATNGASTWLTNPKILRNLNRLAHGHHIN